VTWGQKGETEKELADYTRVIEQLPDAPVEQVAKALNNRGVTWGRKGETEKALADYTRVIEQLRDAPVEQVARALAGRAWAKYERGDSAGFLADTESALHKQPTLDFARFNLGVALLAAGRDAEALAVYKEAGERFPESIETLGLEDLREANQSWLSDERVRPVFQLLESLKK
jgi:tetratricopeptide (TPR) repeat protein